MTQLTAYDIGEIPFSARGSWLNLSPVVGLHRRADEIHLISHKNGMHAVLRLTPHGVLARGESSWQATEATFRWLTDSGPVEAVFETSSCLRFRGEGAGLRLEDAADALTPFTGTYLFRDPVDDSAVFTSYETGRRYRLTMIAGALDVVGAEALGVAQRCVVVGADGRPWEAALEELDTAREPYQVAESFDDVVNRRSGEFAAYVDAVAPWRDNRTPAAGLAAYVLWSATVGPDGFVHREAVLMSKHWMDKVWSWDHCFNAIALAPGLPNMALDQFLLPFDHQDSTGALPDSVSHSEVLYNYVKPPIHGWALRQLRRSAGHDLTLDQLEDTFEKLSRWTSFWLDHRRRAGHRLPYYQHGNDSGWDNSTTFDKDRLVEAPDLAAFLALQCDVLAELALELERDGQRWVAARDSLLSALIDQLWTGTEFVAYGALSGHPSDATSLLNFLPLVLGEHLPHNVRAALAERVHAHLTDRGLATEPVDSPHYDPDGYWRGPIWAPSTALIEDGLRSCGYDELADTVNERFRALCERSGFAENFDAVTGAGLRDRAYTWTAAVYLSFAADHVRRTNR